MQHNILASTRSQNLTKTFTKLWGFDIGDVEDTVTESESTLSFKKISHPKCNRTVMSLDILKGDKPNWPGIGNLFLIYANEIEQHINDQISEKLSLEKKLKDCLKKINK